MRRDHQRLLIVSLVTVVTCFQLAACSRTAAAPKEDEPSPVKVEHLDGAVPSRVTLTEEAVKRLDIHTAAVGDAAASKGEQRRVIPYAAVLYDTEGNTWTYANPEANVYMRNRIVVDHIDGDNAVLSAGPATGMAVVTIGAEELFGSESEFEEE
ncbi:MAG: hypothetical protein AB9M53_08270 [Leptothrix sp. (in: b-proteobacteria)]